MNCVTTDSPAELFDLDLGLLWGGSGLPWFLGEISLEDGWGSIFVPEQTTVALHKLWIVVGGLCILNAMLGESLVAILYMSKQMCVFNGRLDHHSCEVFGSSITTSDFMSNNPFNIPVVVLMWEPFMTVSSKLIMIANFGLV